MKTPFVKVIAVNSVILFAGLCIVELLFGNWLNPNQLDQLNIPRSVTYAFDVSHLYDASEATAAYKRDPYGLRGQYSDPGKIGILTVGGSTTDQRYIDEENTWSAILRKEFERSGKEVSVVNAGLDGQSSYGHIKNFEWWFPGIPGFYAKYFLFYIGINDYYVETGGRSYDEFHIHELSLENKIKLLIKERSASYFLYRTLVGNYKAKFVHKLGHHRVNFESLDWTSTPLQKNHFEIMRNRLQSYRDRLVILSKKVKSAGAIPIFVTQSTRFHKKVNGKILGVVDTEKYAGLEINGVDRYYMEQLLNEVTLETASTVGAISLNLAEELVFEDDDFYDFVHTNPQGSEKIGRYLFKKLDPVLQFE